MVTSGVGNCSSNRSVDIHLFHTSCTHANGALLRETVNLSVHKADREVRLSYGCSMVKSQRESIPSSTHSSLATVKLKNIFVDLFGPKFVPSITGIGGIGMSV